MEANAYLRLPNISRIDDSLQDVCVESASLALPAPPAASQKG